MSGRTRRGAGASGRGSRRADPAGLHGIWRSHAYGLLLEIGPAGYSMHEETAVSCVPVFGGSLEELAKLYVDVRVSAQGLAFTARRSTGVTRVRYRRLRSLPRRCQQTDPARARDPAFNFEVFWHTLFERYALFELRGVDWHAQGEAWRPEVSDDTGARRLFEIMREMLAPLRDGHVELRTPFARFNAGKASAVQRRVARALDASDDSRASHLTIELAQHARAIVRERYLRGRTRSAAAGLFEWGRLDAGTGYLQIHAMAGQSGRPDRPREDQAAAAAAMGRVMADIGELPAIVLDVRHNGGGYDGVALRIAGHFIDRKRLAFTKAASKGHGYAGAQAVFIEPRGRHRYTGRIYLLTSGLTASAAEIFVLALLQQPRVVRVGGPTHGELSDAMERHLPNGWSLQLSNELYRAADGELYEDRGIPPHVAIPFLRPRDVEAGRDPMLDFVLSEEGQ